MDFEKIYNECNKNKFTEEAFVKGEYSIEIFTSNKWETLKRENGIYNIHRGSPVAFGPKEKNKALKLIDELKASRFRNNEIRLVQY